MTLPAAYLAWSLRSSYVNGSALTAVAGPSGTLFNTPTVGSGWTDFASASSEYVSTVSAITNPAGNWTAYARMRPNLVPPVGAGISREALTFGMPAVAGPPPNNHRGHMLGLAETTGLPVAYLTNGLADTFVYGSTAMAVGRWLTMVSVWDGTYFWLRVYDSCARCVSVTRLLTGYTPVVESGQPFELARRTYLGSWYWEGGISHGGLYDSALSADGCAELAGECNSTADWMLAASTRLIPYVTIEGLGTPAGQYRWSIGEPKTYDPARLVGGAWSRRGDCFLDRSLGESSCVALYRCNESSGAPLDYSGNGYDGQAPNGAFQGSGPVDYALDFDGTDDYCELADFGLSDTHSVAVAFRLDSTTGNRTILGKHDPTSGFAAGREDLWMLQARSGTLYLSL
ncbi:MAG TPA: hypothetical protein VFD73_10775, partial [Gemmatimonadales bacterium]|nr:hypothetical protein [Gemmatimonadales bacterium]